MTRALSIVNFLGILLLALLLALEWRRGLALEERNKSLQVESAKRQQAVEDLTEKASALDARAADLDRQLLRATTDLAAEQSTTAGLRAKGNLVASQLATMTSQRDEVVAQRDRLRASVEKWSAAVAQRDEAIAREGKQVKQLADERNDAIAKCNEAVHKFNELVLKYNELVKAQSGGQPGPATQPSP
jgi:chromosome segregation ATPase